MKTRLHVQPSFGYGAIAKFFVICITATIVTQRAEVNWGQSIKALADKIAQEIADPPTDYILSRQYWITQGPCEDATEIAPVRSFITWIGIWDQWEPDYGPENLGEIPKVIFDPGIFQENIEAAKRVYPFSAYPLRLFSAEGEDREDPPLVPPWREEHYYKTEMQFPKSVAGNFIWKNVIWGGDGKFVSGTIHFELLYQTPIPEAVAAPLHDDRYGTAVTFSFDVDYHPARGGDFVRKHVGKSRRGALRFTRPWNVTWGPEWSEAAAFRVRRLFSTGEGLNYDHLGGDANDEIVSFHFPQLQCPMPGNPPQ